MFMDARRDVLVSSVNPDDTVQLRQKKTDKLTTEFNPKPHKVIERGSNNVIGETPNKKAVYVKHLWSPETHQQKQIRNHKTHIESRVGILPSWWRKTIKCLMKNTFIHHLIYQMMRASTSLNQDEDKRKMKPIILKPEYQCLERNENESQETQLNENWDRGHWLPQLPNIITHYQNQKNKSEMIKTWWFFRDIIKF